MRLQRSVVVRAGALFQQCVGPPCAGVRPDGPNVASILPKFHRGSWSAATTEPPPRPMAWPALVPTFAASKGLCGTSWRIGLARAQAARVPSVSLQVSIGAWGRFVSINLNIAILAIDFNRAE